MIKQKKKWKKLKKKLNKSQSVAAKKRWQDPKEKQKQSITAKKRWQDPKEIEKQSIAQRKRWEDKEKRKKQSETAKKRYKDPEEIEKLNIARRKRWEDEEKRKKQSETIKKHGEDKEYRKKQNIAQRKRWENIEEREKIIGESNPRAKKVYCNELNIVFSYVKLAEKYCINVLNSKIGPIRAVCNGKRKSTGAYNGKKLTWNWIENVDKETLDNTEYIDSKKYEEIINAKNK